MAISRTSAGAGVVLGIGIALLTLGTAGIHLYLGLGSGITLFTLNGLGYLGLLALLQLPLPQLARFRPIARWALVGYAALTIVLYFVMVSPSFIGLAVKAIEAALILLLLTDAYRLHSEPSGEASEAHTPGA